MMEHKDVHELIDAYVFGTLSEAEYEAVERHLASGCAECKARLVEVGEVSVGLARGLKLSSPPDRIKGTLMKEVSEYSNSEKYGSETRKSLVVPMVAVAGAIAVIALSVWNIFLNEKITGLQKEISDSRAEISLLASDDAVRIDATILLGKPCTRLVDLKGVEPNKQAFARLFLHPDEDFGVLYAYKLPDVPKDKQYQVWIKLDGVTKSVGLFTVQQDGSALLEFRDLPKVPTIDSFLVTIEPIGGADEPTGMTYLLGPNPLSSAH